MSNNQPIFVFQDKLGNRSPQPRFGFRKYEVLPDGTLRQANRFARRKRESREEQKRLDVLRG